MALLTDHDRVRYALSPKARKWLEWRNGCHVLISYSYYVNCIELDARNFEHWHAGGHGVHRRYSYDPNRFIFTEVGNAEEFRPVLDVMIGRMERWQEKNFRPSARPKIRHLNDDAHQARTHHPPASSKAPLLASLRSLRSVK